MLYDSNSEKVPTDEDIVEAYASTGDGLDFKKAYFARREKAQEFLANIRGEAETRALKDSVEEEAGEAARPAKKSCNPSPVAAYAEGNAAVLHALPNQHQVIAAAALEAAADDYQDRADHNTPADIDPEWLRTRAQRIRRGEPTSGVQAPTAPQHDFDGDIGAPRWALEAEFNQEYAS